MPVSAPTYDLVLVLDPQVDDAARAKIVADSRAAIEAQGELLRHDDWGERPLAYPIERKASGEYHLLQFHAAAAELLSGLDKTLRITDGILRFRIIKLRPGVPDAPDMRSSAQSATPPPSRRGERPGRGEGERAAPEQVAAEPASAEPAVAAQAVAEPA